MKGMILSAIVDFVMLTIAGASFLFGFYLVFERVHPVIAVLLISAAIILALIASYYDLTIIEEREEKTYEEFKKRNRAA